jgi:hypothetical protein
MTILAARTAEELVQGAGATGLIRRRHLRSCSGWPLGIFTSGIASVRRHLGRALSQLNGNNGWEGDIPRGSTRKPDPRSGRGCR